MAKRPPVHGEAWKLLSPSNDGYGIGRVVWAATLAKLHVLDNSGWNTFGVRDAISGPESGMLFLKKDLFACILYLQTFPEQNAGFTVAFPSCVPCSFCVRPFSAVPSPILHWCASSSQTVFSLLSSGRQAMRYLSFCIWLISLLMMLSRSLHFPANDLI